jgi:hypothetical protein
MGKSTVEDVGSALGKAWREATGPGKQSPPKRSKGPLSGMRGVIVGAGLGVLAAKKAGPLVQNAMLKYVASHATEASDGAPSPDQAGQQAPSPDQAGQQAPSPDQAGQQARSPDQAGQQAPSPDQAGQQAPSPDQAAESSPAQ